MHNNSTSDLLNVMSTSWDVLQIAKLRECDFIMFHTLRDAGLHNFL